MITLDIELKKFKKSISRALKYADPLLFNNSSVFLSVDMACGEIYLTSTGNHQLRHETLAHFTPALSGAGVNGEKVEYWTIREPKKLKNWLSMLPARLVKTLAIHIAEHQLTVSTDKLTDTYTASINHADFDLVERILSIPIQPAHQIIAMHDDLAAPLADIADWNKYRNRKVALENGLLPRDAPDEAYQKEDRSVYIDLTNPNYIHLSARDGNTYEILAKNNGTLSKIAFPADSLLSIIRDFNRREIKIEMRGTRKPTIITSEGHSCAYIIMPMQISDQKDT